MQLNPDEVQRRGLCRRPNADVYAVAGNGAALGDYTLSTTLTIAENVWFDGRDGMAISPTDPSREVIIGTDPSGNPVAQLVTDLPLTPAVQAQRLSLPASRTLVPAGVDVGELRPEALTPRTQPLKSAFVTPYAATGLDSMAGISIPTPRAVAGRRGAFARLPRVGATHRRFSATIESRLLKHGRFSDFRAEEATVEA